jgi:hypothetical protein
MPYCEHIGNAYDSGRKPLKALKIRIAPIPIVSQTHGLRVSPIVSNLFQRNKRSDTRFLRLVGGMGRQTSIPPHEAER